MTCEHKGDDITIGFNCRFLINSVRATDGEELLITLKSPTQSITVEPAEQKENFSSFYMILPVRMTE